MQHLDKLEPRHGDHTQLATVEFEETISVSALDTLRCDPSRDETLANWGSCFTIVVFCKIRL